MLSTPSIELQNPSTIWDHEAGQLASSNLEVEAQSPEYHTQFSLPPADGGKDAWLFLFASFLLEALVWGKSLPYLVSIIKLLIAFRVPILLWRFSILLLHP
jgi:hypothetical protein